MDWNEHENEVREREREEEKRKECEHTKMESSLSPLLSLSLPPSLWGVVVRRGLIQLLLVLYKRHGAETPHHI